VIQAASHVILPGVGHAKYVMSRLEQLALINVIKALTQPVLGICLGMQILHEHSDEGNVTCLGIIPGEVKPLPKKADFTLPHMGWNQLNIFQQNNPLLQGIKNNADVYFVHSYAVPVSQYTVAQSHHTSDFAAIVQHENFYGAQFHPERSGYVGAKILENFLT
jgi:glutamine amidotransferase